MTRYYIGAGGEFLLSPVHSDHHIIVLNNEILPCPDPAWLIDLRSILMVFYARYAAKLTHANATFT